MKHWSGGIEFLPIGSYDVDFGIHGQILSVPTTNVKAHGPVR